MLLGCCGVIIVLLIVLLLRPAGNGDNRKVAELEKQVASLRDTGSSENRQIMDQVARQSGQVVEQVARQGGQMMEQITRQGSQTMEQVTRQNEAVVNQIVVLGDGLRDSQDRQQKKTEDAFGKMREDLNAFRQETGGQLTEVNRIVTEKMQEILDRKLNDAFDTVVKNMSDLGKALNDGQERQQKASTEQLAALQAEFIRIRTDISDTLEKIRGDNTASLEKIRAENQSSLDKIRTENQSSLDQINQTVNEKLQKTLNDRITQSFELVNKRLAEVYEGLGEMKNVASGVSDLKNVLSNVKKRGIMGEIQLSAILSDILAPEQYEEQFRINPNGSEMVDFAVKLPGLEDGEFVYLPIDSKFPGDSYANLAAAYDSGDPGELKQKRALLEQEIKRCAKSIQSKYIVPPYSTDFAILFLPFEGLYAEVVNMGLVEVLQHDYHVNITGPSTMAAMLNSLQMGFRTLAIQKKSGEVWKILEAAKQEFGKFETALTKTRDRLRQADDELERLIGTRTRAINRKLRTVSSLEPSEDSAELLELP